MQFNRSSPETRVLAEKYLPERLLEIPALAISMYWLKVQSADITSMSGRAVFDNTTTHRCKMYRGPKGGAV